jgi:phosphoenolpyruvate synthase/pyruvate phosphate dikinase
LGDYYIEDIIENLTYQEILSVLKTPKQITKYDNRRNNYFRIVWPQNYSLNFHYFESKAEFKKIQKLFEHKSSTTKVISGMVASQGVAKGRVKIIKSKDDLKHFKTGDILVAEKTQPRYTHAAIISREFKIPCIVGTTNASKLLKDGDLVEVNAMNGKVMLLE